MSWTHRLRLAVYVLVFALRDIFPVSFFGRDIRERLRTALGSLRSCVSAGLNLLTLTILVTTTTLVAALYVGTVGWLRDYVESNPLARTVEVSSIFSTRTATLEAEDLEELGQLSTPESPAPVEGVFGWNDVTLWFFDSHGSQDDTLTHGRTVDLADPLLSRLERLGGEDRFEGEGLGQIVLSVSLLDALGYGREPPFPESIQIDYGGEAAPVTVVVVAADTPAGDFLISEGFHRALQDRRWEAQPRLAGFYFGPVTPGPDLDAATSGLERWLERQKAEIELVRRAGTEQWLRIERQEPWSEDLWRQLFVPVLEEALASVEPGASVELFEPLPSTQRAFEKLEPQFTRASIYVNELSAVPAVSDEVSELGFRVTSSSREMALLFLQISALGRGILLSVILVVGGLAAVSLVLSFSQSIQRKTPEIAILKAYGASNSLVLACYVLEAVILWAISTAVGLFVAGQAAQSFDERLVTLLQLHGGVADEGATSLVSMPMWLQATVAGGALTLCVAATLLAGSLAVRLQPARALSLHR